MSWALRAQWFLAGAAGALVVAACRVALVAPENTFELVGAHADLACEDCHDPDLPIGPLPTDCASCHADDAPPGHFEGPCEECHDAFGWEGAAVEHDFLPLEDAHLLPCEACHTTPGDFTGLTNTCAACHEPDRPEEHFPGLDCAGCHEPTEWDRPLDHSFLPLENAHALDCATCHVALPDFTGLASECASCHEPDRPAPDHHPGRDCGVCHAPTSWDSGVDHSFFPLIDAHALDCTACHVDFPDLGQLDGECSNCHEPDRPGPDHHPGRDCGVCHTPVQWEVAVDHSFFALTFSHALDCEVCHTAIPDFTGLDARCSTCHGPDRPSVDHYPNFDCGGCHQITGWADGLDHSFFPLGNSHALECDACHANIPDFTGNSPACASCHEADRPDAGHFAGQDCALCHAPSTWSEVASTDHSFFPLENSHALECDDCHVGGTYAGLSQVCSTCHEIHRPGCHFTGQECSACHAPTNTWRLTATPIDHAARFVFRVPHHGADQCAECHETPNTQCQFNCLQCHDDAPGDHQGEPGFQNTSEACVDCHPAGLN